MADIVTSRQFTDGERGITAQKLNDIVGSSTIQPAFYSSKPTAPTADPSDIALILKAGAYAQVPISALAGSATQAQIWSTRLRSYNSLSNPNFEVNQRNPGSGVVFGAGVVGAYICDRWNFSKSAATATLSAGQANAVNGIVVPGTNYLITRKAVNITLNTSQASLAAGEYLMLTQAVEGPNLRELRGDVHSLSLLVWCDQALTFTVRLTSAAAPFYTLTKSCTISTPSQYTLITLPNLPVWDPAATWPVNEGTSGYTLGIGLGAGTTYTSPANDTWQAGNFICGPGNTNYASLPVNTTLQIAMIQHEPGPICTTFMDKPFTQNLDECLRYYQKTYDYAIKPGTASLNGAISLITEGSRAPAAYLPFQKRLAKGATLVAYSPATGLINNVRDSTGAVDRVAASTTGMGEMGYNGLTLSSYNASATQYSWHHTMDTGW